MSALFEPGEQPEPDLEAGWYWVRPVIGGQWVISRWTADAWWPHLEREILEIGPRIPSPDEPPTLLAALDGREAGCPVCALADARWSPHVEDRAWNKAIAACVAALDVYPSGYGVISVEPTRARLRALSRPQPAGEVK